MPFPGALLRKGCRIVGAGCAASVFLEERGAELREAIGALLEDAQHDFALVGDELECGAVRVDRRADSLRKIALPGFMEAERQFGDSTGRYLESGHLHATHVPVVSIGKQSGSGSAGVEELAERLEVRNGIAVEDVEDGAVVPRVAAPRPRTVDRVA